MAIVILGGIATSTALNMIVIPALYREVRTRGGAADARGAGRRYGRSQRLAAGSSGQHITMLLRSIVALGVVATIAVLIAWVLVRLMWSPPSSTAARAALVCTILILTAIGLWVFFVLPAYWD